MRIRQAATLLVSTNLSITAIALDCGFENLSHFSRAFKVKMLKSPKEYRDQNS